MSRPLKLKVVDFWKQSKCMHHNYGVKFVETIGQSFMICNCNKCGKSWVE